MPARSGASPPWRTERDCTGLCYNGLSDIRDRVGQAPPEGDGNDNLAQRREGEEKVNGFSTAPAAPCF